MTTVAAFREALKQNSGECWLMLLTLTSNGVVKHRLVANPVQIVSRGNTFLPFTFAMAEPSDPGEGSPSVSLSMSNTDLRLIELVRALPGKVQVIAEIVTASSPNTVQKGPYTLDLDSGTGDEKQISAKLSYLSIYNKRFPALTYNPQDFPGVFGRTQ